MRSGTGAGAAALTGIALWTLLVAYALPPRLGSNRVRLAAFLVGAALCAWAAARAYRRLAGGR